MEKKLKIYEGSLGRKFVKLDELAEVKGLSSREIWDKFFYWGDIYASELQTTIIEDEIRYAGADGICIGKVRINIRPNIEKGDMLVSIKWAFDILDPQRLAERIHLFNTEAPSGTLVGPTYCLAEAILPNGEIIGLPFGCKKCHIYYGRYQWTLQPAIPLLKALSKGLGGKKLAGQIVNVKIKRDMLPNVPDIVVPCQVPKNDPGWWKRWKMACTLNKETVED